ncbi:Uncharacterised protein [Vibrio cholerae]|nr:Uncharacterised protein [Vibrio cholerae]
MPFAASVSSKLAPSALSSLRRSKLIDSGMVRVNLYPRAAATNARATPVLPLVGSTNSTPGLSLPCFSASQIILAPIRHFTLKLGLRASILASTLPLETLFKRTSGVLPIVSELSS